MLAALTDRLRSVVQQPLFFRSQPLTAWEAIGWWERRRIVFNLVVGVTGILCCFACLLAINRLTGAPAEMPDEFILPLAVLAYAIAANVCFTGGWIVELVVRWLWQEDGSRFASVGFTLGLVFSVLVTLAPAACLVLATCIEALLAP